MHISSDATKKIGDFINYIYNLTIYYFNYWLYRYFFYYRPQRAESGDEIGAAVEESGMKEEMKNFDTKKKSDHYEGHNVLHPRL